MEKFIFTDITDKKGSDRFGLLDIYYSTGVSFSSRIFVSAAKWCRKIILTCENIDSDNNKGMDRGSLWKLVDALDAIRDLKEGESFYLVWSKKDVLYAQNLEFFNYQVMEYYRSHYLSTTTIYDLNKYAYKIKRTNDRLEIYLMKAIIID